MEKFGYKNISDKLNNFYPSFQNFINEANIPRGGLPKIPSRGKVKAKDGTIIDMKEVDNEMESAKTAIVSQAPLFAPYVHQFTPIYTWLVPTMATDGIRLFVNPLFAYKLSWHQKIFVIIHEIMHCVLLHMDRLQGRDPRLFNIAGDLEINPLIVDTLKDFDEAFVKELGGLYDIKYLNQAVEQIYKDIAQKGAPNMPDLSNNQGDPGEGEGEGEGQGQGKGPEKGNGQGGGNQPPQIKVGSKVKIRATGEEGIVTAVNPDGTFEVGPITESFYLRFIEMIKESYSREEIIPIIEGPSDGSGEADGDASGGEQEDQRSESEKKYDEENMPGMSEQEYEVIYREMENSDPAGTGSVISKEHGDKIAEKSGYDVEKGEAGASDVNPAEKWSDLSGKMFNDLKSKSSGKGQGEGLLKRLKELHKSDVNWQSVFRRAVKKALSPEMRYRIPHKKHLGKPYVLRGTYQKRDAVQHIVVAVDVSGSMSQKTIEKIINEVNALIFAKKVKKITLLPFDGGVDESNILTITRSGKAFIKEYRGPGGGTDFQAPIDWVHEKLNDSISLMVLFTDGIAPMPKKPSYHDKFIWMVYDDDKFHQPFGQLVKLET